MTHNREGGDDDEEEEEEEIDYDDHGDGTARPMSTARARRVLAAELFKLSGGYVGVKK